MRSPVRVIWLRLSLFSDPKQIVDNVFEIGQLLLKRLLIEYGDLLQSCRIFLHSMLVQLNLLVIEA